MLSIHKQVIHSQEFLTKRRIRATSNRIARPLLLLPIIYSFIGDYGNTLYHEYPHFIICFANNRNSTSQDYAKDSILTAPQEPMDPLLNRSQIIEEGEDEQSGESTARPRPNLSLGATDENKQSSQIIVGFNEWSEESQPSSEFTLNHIIEMCRKDREVLASIPQPQLKRPDLPIADGYRAKRLRPNPERETESIPSSKSLFIVTHKFEDFQFSGNPKPQVQSAPNSKKRKLWEITKDTDHPYSEGFNQPASKNSQPRQDSYSSSHLSDPSIICLASNTHANQSSSQHSDEEANNALHSDASKMVIPSTRTIPRESIKLQINVPEDMQIYDTKNITNSI